MHSFKATFALVLLWLVSGCRSIDATREESELSSSEERVWFDAYGDQVSCTKAPQDGCPVGSYDATYIDACVAKGFQGKSCGCVAACSGKVVTKQKAPPPPETGTSQGPVCTEADKKAIQETYQSRNSDISRCIDAHLCRGDVGPCSDKAKAVSLKLRALAQGNCRTEVVGRFCGNSAFVESLSCSDAAIAQLSAIYAEAFSGDNPRLRRCLRERFCNIVTGDCTGALAKTVSDTATQASSKGCDYWTAAFCSLK